MGLENRDNQIGAPSVKEAEWRARVEKVAITSRNGLPITHEDMKSIMSIPAIPPKIPEERQ